MDNVSPEPLDVTKADWVKRVLKVDVAALVRSALTQAPSPPGEEPPVGGSTSKEKAVPQISWDDPEAVSWTVGGYILGPTELNASILPPEIQATYTPAAGTTLDVGHHQLRVDTIPTNSYVSANKIVSFEVKKVAATISWSEAQEVEWREGLTLRDLVPEPTVTPVAAGVRCTPPLDTPFTGEEMKVEAAIVDTDHYDAEPLTRSFKFRKATPTIVWTTPDPVRWAPPDGFVITAEQLNAKITPSDLKATYTPAAGATLGVGKEHELRVDTEATATHVAATATVQLVVEPVSAVIAWGEQNSVTWRPGLLLRDVVPAPTVAPEDAGVEVDPPLDTPFTAPGMTVTARLRDTLHYVAEPVTRQVTVEPATPTVVWDDPEPVDYVKGGFVLTDAQLCAVASPGAGEPIYSPAKGQSLDADSHTLKVTFPATATHAKVEHEVTFVVRRARAEIEWAAPDAQTFEKGLTFSDKQLKAQSKTGAALAYQPSFGEPINAGEHQLTVRVAETDIKNYEDESVTVVFRVDRKKPTIEWPEPGILLGTEEEEIEHVYKINEETTRKIKLMHTRFEFEENKPPLNASLKEGESIIAYAPGAGSKFLENAKAMEIVAVSATHGESINYGFEVKERSVCIANSKGATEMVEKLKDGTAFKDLTPTLPSPEPNYDSIPKGTKPNQRKKMKKKIKAAHTNEVTQYPINVERANSLPIVQGIMKDENSETFKQAQELMTKLPNMTAGEMIEYLHEFCKIKKNQDGTVDSTDKNYQPAKDEQIYPNHIWILPNGLQVRMKPRGDGFANPGLNKYFGPKATEKITPEILKKIKPMFCVEVRHTTHFDYDYDPKSGGEQKNLATMGPGDSAGKMSIFGLMSPPGPTQVTGLTKDTLMAAKEEDVVKDFLLKDSIVKSNHLFCRAKRTQNIACKDEILVPYGTKLDVQALGIRLQPGDGPLTIKPPSDLALDDNSLPPVGSYGVTIEAGETNGFEAASKEIKVVVQQTTPRLVWRRPADVDSVDGGFTLTADQLNATAVPSIVGQPTYSHKDGSEMKVGTKLPPGLHELIASVPATENWSGAETRVNLLVRKAVPTITVEDRLTRQEATAGEGYILKAQDLSAGIAPDALESSLMFEPRVDTRLGQGIHEVQVYFKGNEEFRAVSRKVTLTVVAAAN